MTLAQQTIIEDAILRHMRDRTGPHYGVTIADVVTHCLPWQQLPGSIDRMGLESVVVGSVWRLIDHNRIRITATGSLEVA